MTPRDWAGIVVHQTGDWASAEENPERGITLLFFPSTDIFGEIAKKCDRLVRNFNAPQIEASDRTSRLTCLGELVHDLTGNQHVVAAFGRVPEAQWSDARREDVSWAVWPIAAYLPFVTGPFWTVVSGQYLIERRREYQREVSVQFSLLCEQLSRPDRIIAVKEVPACFYEKYEGKETWWEARRAAVVRDEDDDEKGRWYPDPTTSDTVPLEYIRCAVSISEFVSYVMSDRQSEEATMWRTHLQSNLREFDLTVTPWARR